MVLYFIFLCNVGTKFNANLCQIATKKCIFCITAEKGCKKGSGIEMHKCLVGHGGEYILQLYMNNSMSNTTTSV